MAESREVLVIGEVQQGGLSPTTAEALAAGHTVARKAHIQLAVGLVGSGLTAAAQEAIQAGAERVYTVDHALLATAQLDLSLAALHGLCRAVAPAMILLERTAFGREAAPRLAARLGVGLLQDCLQVDFDTASG